MMALWVMIHQFQVTFGVDVTCDNDTDEHFEETSFTGLIPNNKRYEKCPRIVICDHGELKTA